MTPKRPPTPKQLLDDIEQNVAQLDRDLKTHLKYEYYPVIQTIQDDIKALKKSSEQYVLVKEFKPFADGIIWGVRAVLLIVIAAIMAIAFGKITK